MLSIIKKITSLKPPPKNAIIISEKIFQKPVDSPLREYSII